MNIKLESKSQRWVCALAAYVLLVACFSMSQRDPRMHGWWKGLGPVMPHDSFPADCSLCHVGGTWQELRDDFEFDHYVKTGVQLNGAHNTAQCLRCHNDRGPVEMFAARGCVGCHEDLHAGQFGTDCSDCHTENDWRPFGQIELHAQTRFPLTGAHLRASCRSCHLGNEVGRFVPVDTACVSCHRADLQTAANPPHIGLGWVDRCDRCHMPTSWNQAQVAE